MKYDIERHEDCPAEKWVRKTLRQQVEESNVRNLLSDWVVMKATLDPSMTPDNSKYIRFLQTSTTTFAVAISWHQLSHFSRTKNKWKLMNLI
uniref:Uncharacterized protein n=1 Tax=Ditylenchus dipsaci TaxID=166011 RepID=A0A915CXZ1_9BILA